MKAATEPPAPADRRRRSASTGTGAESVAAPTPVRPQMQAQLPAQAAGASRSNSSTPSAERDGAAPRRRRARSLSFRGGEAVAEALHRELARGALLAVEDEDADGGLTLVAPGVISREEGRVRSPQSAGGLKSPRPTVMGDTCHATLSLHPLLARAGGSGEKEKEKEKEKERKRYRELLEGVLDAGPTRSLEKAGVLNWHRGCPRLAALRTESDGNCLCHAASLGAWGVHDRKLLLRQAVRSFLVDGRQAAVRLVRRRWEHELGRHGVQLDRAALDAEWRELARQAEDAPSAPEVGGDSGGGKPPGAMDGGNGGFPYMEATHVFVLAHVLRRPIIVLATDWVEPQGRTVASADEIAGVYLPYGLPRRFLTRTPLVLAYDSFHFSSLVPTDAIKPACVPLVKGKGDRKSLLPLPFFMPALDSADADESPVAALRRYLDVEELADGTLAARIDPDPKAPEGLSAVLLATIIGTGGGAAAATAVAAPSLSAVPVTTTAVPPSRLRTSGSSASLASTSSVQSAPPFNPDSAAARVGAGGASNITAWRAGTLKRSVSTNFTPPASAGQSPRHRHGHGHGHPGLPKPSSRSGSASTASSSSSSTTSSTSSRRRSRNKAAAGGAGGAGVSFDVDFEQREQKQRMHKSSSWTCSTAEAAAMGAPTRKISLADLHNAAATAATGSSSSSSDGGAAAGAGAAQDGKSAGADAERIRRQVDEVLALFYEESMARSLGGPEGEGREPDDAITALVRAVRETAQAVPATLRQAKEQLRRRTSSASLSLSLSLSASGRGGGKEAETEEAAATRAARFGALATKLPWFRRRSTSASASASVPVASAAESAPQAQGETATVTVTAEAVAAEAPGKKPRKEKKEKKDKEKGKDKDKKEKKSKKKSSQQEEVAAAVTTIPLQATETAEAEEVVAAATTAAIEA